VSCTHWISDHIAILVHGEAAVIEPGHPNFESVDRTYAESWWLPLRVLYSATRRDDDPIAIPHDRLPCDRLSPPDPEYVASRDGPGEQVMNLLGAAREGTDRRLSSIPIGAMARPSLWGRAPVDVRERLHQIAVHLVEVTHQAEKMLSAAGSTDSETRKIIRKLRLTRGLHERRSGSEDLARLDRLLLPLGELSQDA